LQRTLILFDPPIDSLDFNHHTKLALRPSNNTRIILLLVVKSETEVKVLQ
jgi:hypothetical protein